MPPSLFELLHIHARMTHLHRPIHHMIATRSQLNRMITILRNALIDGHRLIERVEIMILYFISHVVIDTTLRLLGRCTLKHGAQRTSIREFVEHLKN